MIEFLTHITDLLFSKNQRKFWQGRKWPCGHIRGTKCSCKKHKKEER